MKFNKFVSNEYKPKSILEQNNYSQFCQYLHETNYLTDFSLTEKSDINESINDKIKLVKTLANTIGAEISKIAKIFEDSTVFEFFSLIGWSLKKLWEIVKKGFQFYEKLQKIIAEYIHNTHIGRWTHRELRKLQKYLEDHPIIKKMTGIGVAGILIFIWLNMTFTGNPKYDFDLSDMVAALKGEYSLEAIFASAEGIRLLLLFATGVLLGLSFPWPGATHAQFVIAVTFGLAKHVGIKIGHISENITLYYSDQYRYEF